MLLWANAKFYRKLYYFCRRAWKGLQANTELFRGTKYFLHKKDERKTIIQYMYSHKTFACFNICVNECKVLQGIKILLQEGDVRQKKYLNACAGKDFAWKNYISVLVHVIVIAILFARKHKVFKSIFQKRQMGEKTWNIKTQILIKTILKAVSMAFNIFINTSNAVTSLKVKAHFQIQVLLEYI